MENELQHSGIYIDENSLLPKSIAQVETAVPAFIGYTEKAFFNGVNLHLKNKFQPFEINSFAEYEKYFGGAPEPASFEFLLDSQNTIVSVRAEALSFLYYSVKLFFDNGGVTCLIVSVGSFAAAAGKDSKKLLLKGLACLEKTDAPTLLVMPDAAKLSYAEAGELHIAMLKQSSNLKNRFALLDLVNGNCNMWGAENPVDSFRQNLGMNSLSYGAAYYPWLVTSWNCKTYRNAFLAAKYFKNGAEVKDLSVLFNRKTIDLLQKADLFLQRKIQFKQQNLHLRTGKEKTAVYATELYKFLKEFYNLVSHETASNTNDPFSALHIKHVSKSSAFHIVVKKLHVFAVRNRLPLQTSDFITDFRPLKFSDRPLFIKERVKKVKNLSVRSIKLLVTEADQLIGCFYDDIEKLQFNIQEQLKKLDSMYDSVVKAIEAQKVIVPSGGAVAGIIAQIDRQRGVWKAPANVSMTSVIRPAVEEIHHDQDFLNVNAVEGKSINAIRFFPGKGVLIWGARTLAGNDNEWRYVNVRRFCIMVEQSLVEAIQPFLFEPNNEASWGKIRKMVDDFYNSLWRAGALQGTKPGDAYFIKLGLGETMTASDIENGVMKLATGLAVVKPAEFIMLSIALKIMMN